MTAGRRSERVLETVKNSYRNWPHSFDCKKNNLELEFIEKCESEQIHSFHQAPCAYTLSEQVTSEGMFYSQSMLDPHSKRRQSK